eukprot:9207829-Alexandrium_andersonii.AAC.1
MVWLSLLWAGTTRLGFARRTACLSLSRHSSVPLGAARLGSAWLDNGLCALAQLSMAQLRLPSHGWA